jgi:hypothetical protein
MSFFGGSPSYTPPPPPTSTGLTDEEIAAQEAAKSAEKAKVKARKGFASTILGGASSTNVSTEKKSLLGA